MNTSPELMRPLMLLELHHPITHYVAVHFGVHFPYTIVTPSQAQRMDEAQSALSVTGDVISAIQTQSELWEETYQRLKRSDSQVLQVLDFDNASVKDLNDALDAATKAQQGAQGKGWKVHFRGKEYELYDVFSNIVGFIKAFQKVVDSVVSLDLSGKAALPWAAIKFLLDVRPPLKQFLICHSLIYFAESHQRA
jgi:hypothetical protein